MTKLMLAGARYPVTVLGPGQRAGIWTQGCTIGCANCVARDTWPADPATAVDTDVVLGWLASLPGPVQGITISGGEPFQQPEALAELLHGIAAWRAGRDADILVYTGYTLSRLRRADWSARLLALCDAVVAGPYVAARNTGLRWRGSSNQRFEAITDLGRGRYAEASVAAGELELQIGAEGDRLRVIGIPRPGDMDALARRLADAGLHTGKLSWRS
jgi:anaerobic ribonucleoside-triphosphate reductase activating protein